MVFARMLWSKYCISDDSQAVLAECRTILNKAAAALDRLGTETPLVRQCISYIKYLANVQDDRAADAFNLTDGIDADFDLGGLDAFLSQGGDLGPFLPSELMDFSLMGNLTTNFN